MLALSLAFAGILGTIEISYAAEGDAAFSMRIDGELWIWSGSGTDWASAYPKQRVYDLTPLTDSADRIVTGCSGSLALGVRPAVLKAYARLQSDPGPGCAQSSVQGVAEVKDTLRFWASEGNIGDPLRLDLEFDFSGSHTYDVNGWPDAYGYIQYALDFRLIEVTQTYPDGSLQLGATLGEITARRGFSDGTPFHEIISYIDDDLEFVTSDASGEFGPGQTLTLRVTTKRGAQVSLWWMLSTYIEFNNRNQPSGTEVAIIETDFGNSLELINAVVHDPTDESIVTDSGLMADSGFDYLALPEPGRNLLAFTAFSALAILHRWSTRHGPGTIVVSGSRGRRG